MKETVSAFVNSNCDLGLVGDANIKLLWAEVECGGKPQSGEGAVGKALCMFSLYCVFSLVHYTS